MLIKEILKKVNSVFFYVSIVTLSILFAFFIFYTSQYCCFFDDDTYYSTYRINEGIFDCLISNSHGGKYFGQFLDKFFSVGLPCILRIHPENFLTSWHAIFRAISLVVILLTISKFSTIYEKSKNLYLIFFIFLISIIISFILGYHRLVIVVYYAYYRYCFSLLFFSIFLFFIFENIMQLNNNTSKLKLIFVSLCGYIVGTSSEIAFFTLLTLITLIITWNLIITFIARKNNNLLDSLKITLNHNFYVPVASFIAGVTLFVTSEGFKNVALDRGMGNINITYDLFKEFFIIFLNNYIICIKVVLIIFLLLFFVALYFAVKNKNLRPILFSIIYIISCFSVMFSLVLCGKNNCNETFFVEHENVLFLAKTLLLFPFAIILSYIYSSVKKYNKNLYIFYFIIILLLGYTSVNCIPRIDIMNPDSFWFNRLYYKKSNNYIREKITRFYFIKNEPSIIPPELLDGWDNQLSDDNCIYEENISINNNYKRIYKEFPNISPYICISENAINQFYERGGYITKEELKTLDFNRLFDETYILNKKENKIYTPEEINEFIKINTIY